MLAVRTGRLVSWKARQAGDHATPQNATSRRAAASRSATTLS